MRQIRGKIWGSSCCLFDKGNMEIHRIEVHQGGFCSEHMHKYKWNAFFVETGCLEITVYREDAGKPIEDRTRLSGGESTYVEPGLYHKFTAIEPTVAFEFYWTELPKDDIIRREVGGTVC